jgi:RNA polymerase sigma-70 factor (ECF subfamily)
LPDDFDLLDAWRAGDPAAADALVRRYYAPVLRFFEVRTRAAEDLTQRTFLACVEGRERFRGDSTFRAYLFAIAHRLLMAHLADAHRGDRLAGFGSPEAEVGTSLSAVIARKQEQQLVLAALATLDEAAQSLLVLYYWEGMMAKEIADVLEAPVSTITTRLSRARQALRERIEKMIKPGRAGSAVLNDLEGWTRSLVSAEADAHVGSLVPAGVLATLAGRRG